jgi:hypothetical protein
MEMTMDLPFTNGNNGGDDRSPLQTFRDRLGRFGPGNQAAVGHQSPFAKQSAALRKAFYQEATAGDLRAIARQLLDKVKAGDLAATKLVLLWTLSKPAEPTDPDGVDLAAEQQF